MLDEGAGGQLSGRGGNVEVAVGKTRPQQRKILARRGTGVAHPDDTEWDRPALTQVQRPRPGSELGPVRGYSLRTERYRYTQWDDGREGEELYDYSGDPRELKNLATSADAAEAKSELRSRMRQIIESRRA